MIPPSFCFVYSNSIAYMGCIVKPNLVLTCSDCVKNATLVKVVTLSSTIDATKLYISNEIALVELSSNIDQLPAILNNSTIQPNEKLFMVKNYAEQTTTDVTTKTCSDLKICYETMNVCSFQSGNPLYKDNDTVYGILPLINLDGCSDLSSTIIDISNYNSFISDVIANKVAPTKVLGEMPPLNLMYESNCNIYTSFDYINNSNSNYFNTYYLGKTLLTPTNYTVNPNDNFNPYNPDGTNISFFVKLDFFNSSQYKDFINEYAKISKGEVMFVYKYPKAKVPYAKIEFVALKEPTTKLSANDLTFQIYTFKLVQPIIDICTVAPTVAPVTNKPTVAAVTKSGLSTGAIAGIAVGSVVVAGFLIYILFFSSPKKKGRKRR